MNGRVSRRCWSARLRAWHPTNRDLFGIIVKGRKRELDTTPTRTDYALNRLTSSIRNKLSGVMTMAVGNPRSDYVLGLHKAKRAMTCHKCCAFLVDTYWRALLFYKPKLCCHRYSRSHLRHVSCLLACTNGWLHPTQTRKFANVCCIQSQHVV